MKSSEYWRQRFESLEKSLDAIGQETYSQVEPAFNDALREIDGQIEKWLHRIAVNNKLSMIDARKLLDADQLAEFHWSVWEYIKHGEENAIDQRWMKELENASAKFHISKLEAMKLQTQQALERAYGNYLDGVDDMARKVYTEGYYRTAFEIQKGIGVGYGIGRIDEGKLSKLIAKPWAADGRNFSDRIWQSKTQMVNDLHKQLVRTCIMGESPDKAIKVMMKYAKTGVKNAKAQAARLIMTEQAFFASAATKDSYLEFGVKEFEIIATLDSHTSEICRDLDGRHFPMKDYEPGVTAPPFHVYCRSTTCPYFDDEFTFGEMRAARGEDGKTYYVPADMKYEEWRSAVDSGDFLNLLTMAEKGAVMRYLGGEAYALNAKLRHEIELNEDEKWWVNYLEAALKKMPNYEGMLCRSITVSKEELKSFFEQHRPGKIVLYKAFSSAEKLGDSFAYYNPDANVQVFIKSQTGKDISSFNPGENEVLYPTGSEFIVKEVEQQGDKYFVLLEEKL